ncbi:glycoside hydrolase family 35 protein [Dothidotthia symphoricarpi CBS 119687]|uniref:beta-galactosidase n=1 Tax=Dothidotthia symphoricarpi CBS 119687 TaxID=1392245 RepID=A0A6A6AK78_9PLEO|nr:glycoside hydrolase family 35 protein [Dothidotthia symphoricarpi CBS 119687]KAF2132359.1 glycoside hydrolase family 35 protein [Dothidotthia symphoricarpi CBS 119687]
MRLFRSLFGLATLLLGVLATDNGLQTTVTWDNGSLMVKGERVMIMSGEFHYARLPVPELWLDVFQKFKASGMNTVSIYFFWSYHSASKGVYDFTTPGKDIQRLFDMAQEAGLYVIARPGPYCNAETNAGGFALWTSDGSGGSYRTSDGTYQQVWSEWITEIGAIIKRNQITNGGPVILTQVENELTEGTRSPTNTLVVYMEQLKTAFKEAGIIVPLTHNEKGFRGKSWSTDYQNVGGAIDVYGLDSYPGGMSCTNLDTGFNLPKTYYQWFQEASPTQPMYIPEFEGGWFQPWGGYFFDQCQAEHSPEFADVFYKGMIAQRVTLLNLYMAFGGTNWGHSAAPVVFTSYDYSAPLRETREIREKFMQYKLLSLFTRVSKGLHNTEMESNGTGNAVSSPAIWTWVLKNRDTDARFYLAQNDNTKTRAVTDFAITVDTSAGDITIPSMQLKGRQSRWVVTDYALGNETLLYSSAEVLTYGTFNHPVVVFYLKEGQTGEFAFKSQSNVTFSTYGADSNFARTFSNGTGYTSFTYEQSEGATVVQFSNGVLAYLLDVPTAYTFYAPSTTSDPNVTPDQQIFAIGPYLVRSASVSGDVVSIIGDNAVATTLEVYAGAGVNTISWNGKELSTSATRYGSLTAQIPGVQDRTVTLPPLTDFLAADSAPEISPAYDDSKWTVANKNTTLSQVKPLTLPVLFSSDYAFYTGAKIYRGYFAGTSATALNLTVQGGVAAGWNAWLNGQPLGYHPGNVSQTSTTAVLSFNNITLAASNVLTVITDYTGHDQTSTGPTGAENPRGILGAQLLGTNSTTLPSLSWKITGNAGGEANIDPVRGPMNEGGLYGERLGWHLPGFPSTDWQPRDPITTGVSGTGITWFTTSFPLAIDADLDVPIGVELIAPAGTVARILLFVNGYQFGKYLPHIGPQTVFPVPPGILNMRGDNTLSLAVWAQTGAGAKLDTVRLVEYARFESGFGFSSIDGEALQTGWTDRSEYA